MLECVGIFLSGIFLRVKIYNVNHFIISILGIYRRDNDGEEKENKINNYKKEN